MKILETIFFILMFVIPGAILGAALLNLSKLKTDTKLRIAVFKIILLIFVINGLIWGTLKIINDRKQMQPEEQTTDIELRNDNSSNNVVDSNQKDLGTYDNTIATTTYTFSKLPVPEGESIVIGSTSNGLIIEQIDGVTYVNGILVANKTYSLPESYVPSNTYKPVNQDNCADCLDKLVLDAYNKMKSDAATLGLTLWIASGYRSYNYQTALYNGYVNRSGKSAADTYSARPGHSEHQSGLAFDLNDVSQSFKDTKEGAWVNENCYKYGFIVRYPEGKDSETGYIYEPWHLRYVGEELATILYNDGDWIALETYLGITSNYRN